MENQKKYSLLIVDDEPMIADGLRDLFEEEFGELFRIYHCYYPKKALEIFRFRLPDVVVSDVRMPKMTGIEMAEEMRKIKPDIHVLFLSGYEEFDYVYSAIKQDADDYILKTEGDEFIVKAMRKMIGLLESEHLFDEEYRNAQSRISYMAPVFKQRALIHILDGDIITEEEFDNVMEGLEHPLSKKGNILLLLGALRFQITQEKQEQILETVDQVLQKTYGDKIYYIHKVMYHKTFVWMLETEEVQLPELLLVAAQDIQNMIQLKMNLIMAFGIASEGSGWREIPQKYNDLWEEMRRQSLNGEDSIFLQNGKESITDSFNGEETDFSSMFLPLTEKLGLLENFLSEEDFAAFESCLKEVLEVLSASKRHSMYALELYYAVGNIMISYINKKNIRPQLATHIQLMELFDPGSFVTWKEGADYLLALTQAIREICRISNENVMTGIAEKTKSYILSHLAEDLSLTVIGKAMGFNSVYLSRIFKRQTGISIREYIEACRMDLAKKLIVNSRMKIYEVAEKCGYQNPAYFIKIFRAHFGITPQECRDGRK